MSALGLYIALLQVIAGPSPRAHVRAVDYAADRGKLDSAEAVWRGRGVPRVSSRTRRLVLATLSAYRYRFDDAERALNDVRRGSLGDGATRQAALDLGRIKLAQGYAATALPLIEQAEREARAARDTLAILDAILTRGEAVATLARPTDALAIIDSAVTISASADTRLSIAFACRRGALFAMTGDHRRARDVLRRGAERASTAGLLRSEGRCRQSLLTSFISTGETDSARVQWDNVNALANKAGDLGLLAAARQWTGYYVSRLGNSAIARTHLDSAVRLARITRSDQVLAWAAYNLTELALQFRDAKGAFQWLTLCDSLMRARGDLFGSASTPALHISLAWLRGDYDAAIRLMDSAVALANGSGNPSAQVAAYEERRWGALRLGRIAEAADALQRRRDLTSRFQLRGYGPSLTRAAAEHALVQGDLAEADSLFAEFERTLHPRQYALKHDVLLQRALARVLAGDMQTGLQHAREAGAAYTQWRASLRDAADRKRAAQSAAAFGDAYGLPRLIAELVRRGRPDVALELSEQRRAQHLREALSAASSNPVPTVRQLQAVIPERTAVFEYVLGVGDAPTSLIVATRDTVAAFDLGPASALAERITRFTTLLETRRDARELARQLGALLVQPAQSVLTRGVNRVVIVPDGALNFVPFDALMLRDGRFLLDDVEASLVPSLAIAATWWQPSAARSAARRSLVFGDPAYPRTQATALPRLPASGREARRVAALLRDADLALGDQASEARLNAAARRDLSVLHMASHAVVDDWSSDRSFIALAPAAGHDGVVSIDDLTSLGIRANLVVLSACKTARGEVIGGEGVQSLARPFLEQGARAVVATAWAVEDRRAFALVDRFYGGLTRGVPVGAALRDARLALKASGASPSDWSSYVLLGDASLRIAEPATPR